MVVVVSFVAGGKVGVLLVFGVVVVGFVFFESVSRRIGAGTGLGSELAVLCFLRAPEGNLPIFVGAGTVGRGAGAGGRARGEINRF